jgi:hypothetical protein
MLKTMPDRIQRYTTASATSTSAIETHTLIGTPSAKEVELKLCLMIESATGAMWPVIDSASVVAIAGMSGMVLR